MPESMPRRERRLLCPLNVLNSHEAAAVQLRHCCEVVSLPPPFFPALGVFAITLLLTVMLRFVKTRSSAQHSECQHWSGATTALEILQWRGGRISQTLFIFP
ncbi:hypothetical protein BGY98DRAFT_938505 [Russula aff. rugulosa BPL654]|nr:hypothetical protein BGY98DRAFT_938505 [Russula aff. rugulosa BPL654]